jgi:DNA-binding beta-propeller fold protein YncE
MLSLLAPFLFLWSLTSLSEDVATLGLGGIVTTLGGDRRSSGSLNGIGTNAEFNDPFGITLSSDDSFALVAENHLIRRIILSTASISTLTGTPDSPGSSNGIGSNAEFNYPSGVSVSPDGSFALVADRFNSLIRLIVLSTASVSTLAGVTGAASFLNGIGTNARFAYPFGVCVSSDGSFALVADTSNHLIRLIVLSTASVTTLAGTSGSSGFSDGIGTNTKFNGPFGISLSPDDSFALVADTDNQLMRMIVLSTVSVSILAGARGSYGPSNGVGTNAEFQFPFGVNLSPNGSFALVADTNNCLIRLIILSSATVSTLAGVPEYSGFSDGTGTNAKFYDPSGISIASGGLFALVADRGNNLIRRIDIMTLTTAPTFLPTISPTLSPTFSPIRSHHPHSNSGDITPVYIAVAVITFTLLLILIILLWLRRQHQLPQPNIPMAVISIEVGEGNHGISMQIQTGQILSLASSSSESDASVYLEPQYLLQLTEGRQTDHAKTNQFI